MLKSSKTRFLFHIYFIMNINSYLIIHLNTSNPENTITGLLDMKDRNLENDISLPNIYKSLFIRKIFTNFNGNEIIFEEISQVFDPKQKLSFTDVSKQLRYIYDFISVNMGFNKIPANNDLSNEFRYFYDFQALSFWLFYEFEYYEQEPDTKNTNSYFKSLIVSNSMQEQVDKSKQDLFIEKLSKKIYELYKSYFKFIHSPFEIYFDGKDYEKNEFIKRINNIIKNDVESKRITALTDTEKIYNELSCCYDNWEGNINFIEIPLSEAVHLGHKQKSLIRGEDFFDTVRIEYISKDHVKDKITFRQFFKNGNVHFPMKSNCEVGYDIDVTNCNNVNSDSGITICKRYFGFNNNLYYLKRKRVDKRKMLPFIYKYAFLQTKEYIKEKRRPKSFKTEDLKNQKKVVFIVPSLKNYFLNLSRLEYKFDSKYQENFLIKIDVLKSKSNANSSKDNTLNYWDMYQVNKMYDILQEDFQTHEAICEQYNDQLFN